MTTTQQTTGTIDLSKRNGEFQPIGPEQHAGRAALRAAGFQFPSPSVLRRIGSAWEIWVHPSGLQAREVRDYDAGMSGVEVFGRPENDGVIAKFVLAEIAKG